jgi:vapD-related protein
LQSKDDLWKNGVVLSFDLDTKLLKKYYSKTSPQNAYRDIKKYLIENGFGHTKDTDYVNTKIEKVDTIQILNDFSYDNKWFPICVNKINISPNVKSLDISLQINKLTDEKWKMQRDNELKKDKSDKSIEKRSSLLKRVSKKKEELGKENTNLNSLNKENIER